MIKINNGTVEITHIDRHEQLCKEIHETYTRKNHDYGNSFHNSYKKYGIISAMVRMEDKWNRLETLTKKQAQVKDESITDTLKDLANYCLMTIIEMEEIK